MITLQKYELKQDWFPHERKYNDFSSHFRSNSLFKNFNFTVLSFGQITNVFRLHYPVMVTDLIWSSFFNQRTSQLPSKFEPEITVSQFPENTKLCSG